MTRAAPEHSLQVQVTRYLKAHLHPSVFWTASLTGTNLSMTQRNRAKAAGVRKGWPDVTLFNPADGRTLFVELKSPTGSLTPEQRAMRDAADPHGLWKTARSVEDVRLFLLSRGVRLRAHPFERFPDEADA